MNVYVQPWSVKEQVLTGLIRVSEFQNAFWKKSAEEQN